MDYLYLDDLAKELAELEDENADEAVTLDEEGFERLEALRGLQAQLFNDDMAEYAENEAAMIPEEEFVDYCQEFADSVGYLSDDSPLYYYIDWERWAKDIQRDYTKVEFEGDTYLIRAY